MNATEPMRNPRTGLDEALAELRAAELGQSWPAAWVVRSPAELHTAAALTRAVETAGVAR